MAITLGHDFLLGAYDALLEDVKRWIPDANDALLDRDLSLLRSHLVNRGDRFFTIDLPDACKAFERCLADGALQPINVPGFGMARHHGRKDRRPKLFWALWSRVFTSSGLLRQSPCTTSIYFLRQLMRLFAKYRMECADAYRYAAVKDFDECEQGLPPPSLDWEDPDEPYSRASSLHLSGFSSSVSFTSWGAESVGGQHGCRLRVDHYQRIFDLLAATLPAIDIFSLRGRHGPGAVSDGTGTRSKYEFPVWPSKLEAVFPFDWFGSTALGVGELFPRSGITSSKLICVPKSAKGPRLIAAEPIANQFTQQALMAWFLDAFKTSLCEGSINIKDQSISQEAARVASYGNGATIDLKSASDRLTCRLVERVFRKRPEILSAMLACRTPLLRQDIDKSSRALFVLKKFATQGSALTFPVQSFVFFCISIAAVTYNRGLAPTIENVRKVKKEVVVYGDDIIIDKASYRELVDALHQLGLKVNEHKSFGTGLFRESCGSDWYDGSDVTPAYITSDFDRSNLTTIASVIETSNNFLKKGCWLLSDFLAKRIPGSFRNRIAVENGSLAIKGLYSFVGNKLDHLKRRFNKSLHRYEYKCLTVTGKITGSRPDGLLRLRQWFTEEPDPEVKWDPVSYSRVFPSVKLSFKAVY